MSLPTNEGNPSLDTWKIYVQRLFEKHRLVLGPVLAVGEDAGECLAPDLEDTGAGEGVGCPIIALQGGAV